MQLLRLNPMPQPSGINCRTALQFQLANSMPDLTGNSCTAALNAFCCALARAGGTPSLLENQSCRTALAEGGGPPSDGMGIPFQCVRRCRGRPALGRHQHGAPPLPGRRRHNHPPAQIPGFHLPLFEKPLYLPHTHHPPLSPQAKLIRFLHNFTPCLCTFHFGFGLV